MRVYIAQLNPTIGAMEANCAKIEACIDEAKRKGCDLVVCPEMAICGYMPDDLLLEKSFIDAVEKALSSLITKTKGIALIVGTVRRSESAVGKPLKNSAAVVVDGKLLGFQDKSLLPTYDVFDEWRYFEPTDVYKTWEIAGTKLGITVCEDLWPTYDPFCSQRYPHDPLQHFEKDNVDLLINISASPYSQGKIETRSELTLQAARRLQCPVILVNQVGAQDGLIYDGSSLIASGDGELLARAPSFSEAHFAYDFAVKTAVSAPEFAQGQELYLALCMGLKDYFVKQGFCKAVLGLSGGIDSSVVACIAVAALGKDNVLGALLPSRFTSGSSRADALALATNLGIATCELSIEEPLHAFLEVLEPVLAGGEWGLSQENLQSRIRGDLLMAISNEKGYLL
ncbi:MAG: NAD(+) synthase, partial [Verrucomicrobia bacterium]|nr:NAD(+) synthase [Verrucomicrobiota bacterium]